MRKNWPRTSTLGFRANLRRATALVTAAAIVLSQLAFPPFSEASHLGSSTASAGSAPPPAVSTIQSFQPDLFTGRATTGIPIAVPPGRKGVQPSLALAYSSSSRNGTIGVGWSLDVGYIERNTKKGVPKYDSSDTFTFLFQGVSSELVQIPDGTYRVKDEGAFLRFENLGVSGWRITDKSGTKYFFGQAPSSRLQADDSKIFRWALDKVIDLNGNSQAITYTKDQNQLYLAAIDYTAHEPTGLAPLNRVEFFFEGNRPDVETSYRSGFAITTAKRLKTIDAKTTLGQSLQLAHRYQLSYSTSSLTGRSLLSSVTPIGSDAATSLPPVTFSYTAESPTYLHCHNCVPSITSGNHGWQIQTHVGNLFPRDDGGNDQRLWPSGAWEPGYKTWIDDTCNKIIKGLVCIPIPMSASIPFVSWGNPHLELSGSSDGISWSTDANGNLSISGPQDSHLLAITWLYTTTSKTVSFSSLGVSGKADVFYVPPGGSSWSVASDSQVPLSSGWTVVAVTAYNELGGFSLSMSASPALQVTAMNHAQFSPMDLSGDFNGDGYTDLAYPAPSTNYWHVVLNSPSGFSQEQAWLNQALPAEVVPLVGDADADSLTDLILWNASSGLWQVARSTGSSFLNPTPWHSGFGAGQTPFMGDFNGDGFLDVGTFSSGTWQVALSTGASFNNPTTWLSGFGSTPLSGDFNGDGLTDVASASGGTISVALSDGSRLIPQASSWTTNFGSGQSVASADLNGDGLTDVLYYDKSAGTIVYAPSTGLGFGSSQTLMSDHPFELRSADDVLQLGDFRGNGLSGFGVFNAISGAAEIAFAMGLPADLLKTTANGLGAATTLNYGITSELADTKLPFAMTVVRGATISDGMGSSYSTQYTYSGGRYDSATKEFRGFRIATVSDAIGTTTQTTFSQDLHTKGRVLSVEMKDAQGRLFSKSTNTWSCTEPYSGVHFVKLDQTDSFIYDGDNTFRQMRSRFIYDPYGNLLSSIEDGQVDPPISGDEPTETASFTYNTAAWILNKPVLTQTLDAQGVVVSQRRFYYDNASDYTTPPTLGLLTKEEAWLNVELDPVNRTPSTVNRWISTRLTYDSYGNVKTITDARNRTTTNTYDSTGTFLTTITNPLGYSVQSSYDPRTGQVMSSTDINGVTATTEYDALGRVTKVIGPLDTSALPMLRYEYDLSSLPLRTIVHSRIQSGQPQELTVYSFSDALGRGIQTRSPAEDSTQQVVSGAVELDSRGLVIKQWTSYLEDFSSSYVPVTSPTPRTPPLAPPVIYTYDAIGRLIETKDPDGSVTLVNYNDGETTTSLANGTQTARLLDAAGRLVRVEEFMSDSEKYTTTYQYDALNNLIRVTDHLGNVTSISYDSLGRKLSMDDPDMGQWSYTYDDVDNLSSQRDARGVVISFTYDTLNRLLRKDYDDSALAPRPPPLAPVIYTYDNPAKPFSKGKLTGITDGSGSSSFDYDSLGRLVKEQKTISGTTYTIQRSYDLLGRLVSLTYPDSDVASYTYNSQGGIETIALDSLVTGHQSLVTDVGYNAAGQLTKISYGNGTVSDYTYDPQTLRLSSLVTSHQSLNTILQDFSYAFDAVGNVSAITDRVHTSSQSFQYDNLNRLTSAYGSYGNSSYAYDAIGNMLSKEGASLTYGLSDGSKPHAVTSATSGGVGQGAGGGGLTLTYDANGNLLEKNPCPSSLAPCPSSQFLTYDAENRLVDVKTPQETTITLMFKPGWNFFSLPVIPDDPSITAIFPNFSSDFEQIAWFDANPQTPDSQRFKHFVNNPKFNQFDKLQYNQGYQAYCENPNGLTVTITGKLPTQQPTTTLLPGWHLLPASSLEPLALPEVFSGIDYDQILEYDAQTQVLLPATQADSGKAYFVNVRTSSAWTPPVPDEVITQFVYDGDGGRVKKTTSAGTTVFLGQSYEIASDGTATKYVFAGGQRIAAKDSTGALRFYHGDHLGSSNVITDSSGNVIELSEYTPYGSFSPSTSHQSLVTDHYFTGQRLDSSTGLYFYGARYYDSSLGRFISPDTIIPYFDDPQSLNRYSYARNNPVILVDPSGHFFWIAAIIGAFVGGALGGVSAAMSGQPIWKGIVFGALSGLGAGIASLPNALAWGAYTGFASSMAMGGNPLIGAGLGMLGVGLGRGAASFVGPNAHHFARAAASALVGGVTGGIGAVAYGGEFGEGFGYGAAFGLAGYGLSVAANKVAVAWVNNQVNSRLDAVQREIDKQIKGLTSGTDKTDNQQKAPENSLDVALDRLESTLKSLKRAGLEFKLEVGGWIQLQDKGSPGRFFTEVTLPAFDNVIADNISLSARARIIGPYTFGPAKVAGGFYGPYSARFVTNLNQDLSYGRIYASQQN